MHATVHAPWGQLTVGLALLLLPGAALGTSPESEKHAVAVGFLVFLLLLLLLVLALAWRKLSHDSEGRYHPRRLCQPRRLLGAVARRWRALQGETPPERQWEGKEDDEEEEEEEELETLQRDEEEGGGGQAQQSQEEDAEVPEGTPPCDPPREAPEEAEEGGGTGGLLSDLHSFSGTATWEDSATEGGCRQHVTAL